MYVRNTDSMNYLFDRIRTFLGLATDAELAKSLGMSLSLLTSIRKGIKGLTMTKRHLIQELCPDISFMEIFGAMHGKSIDKLYVVKLHSCKKCGLVYDYDVVHPDSLICLCERR
jgi:hypothetical protein